MTGEDFRTPTMLREEITRLRLHEEQSRTLAIRQKNTERMDRAYRWYCVACVLGACFVVVAMLHVTLVLFAFKITQ